MLRWFVFLFSAAIIALLCSWLIHNNGSVIIELLGYHVETSTSVVLFISTFCLAVGITLLASILWIVRIPARYRHTHLISTHSKGLHALTQGFAAVAAGDTRHARKFVRQATACLGNIPLTHILTAQTAQLTGDRALAKAHYTAMLENSETHVIALRGLLAHARQEGDIEKAIRLAEQAYALKASVPWALPLLVELYPQARKWDPAIRVIREAVKRKLLPAPQGDRMLGVIALAKSQHLLEQQHMDAALQEAKHAYKLLPDFVPAVVHYATLLDHQHDKSKALKILEHSWKEYAHPDVIQTYWTLVKDEASEKTLSAMERLAQMHHNIAIGYVMAAQMAMDIKQYSQAKDHLDIALSIEETPLICRLMAEVERSKHASQSTIDQWLERAQSIPSKPETCWHCSQCHMTAPHWRSNCVRCLGFDTFAFNNETPSFANHTLGCMDATLL